MNRNFFTLGLLTLSQLVRLAYSGGPRLLRYKLIVLLLVFHPLLVLVHLFKAGDLLGGPIAS
jgi:hypothetical protein